MEVNQTSDSSQDNSNSTQEVSQSVDTGLGNTETLATEQVAEGVVNQPEVPAYQPNFKFKVLKAEHEIPEHFRPIVKDEKTNKELIELFERSHGLDHVKSDRARLQEEYRSYRTHWDGVIKAAESVMAHKSRGDLDSAFQALGWSEKEIFDWAVKKAELQALPQDQRAAYDKHREAELKAWELEQQLQSQQEEYNQLRVQTRQSELDSLLESPEFSHIVKAFDQSNGPDAFKQELILRGQTYFHTRGIDVPASYLMKEMAQMYGGFVSQQPQAQSQTQPVFGQPSQAATKTVVSAPKQVPTIPNTGGSSASPAKRKVSSLADIRKAYEELEG